jgi:hypothetical protein
MILSVEERIVLLSLLPVEGSYATLKILTDLRMSLSFTEEEMKDWGIVNNPGSGQTIWKTNGETEIPIGEKATDIVEAALKKHDAEKSLPIQALDLYEKFITTE